MTRLLLISSLLAASIVGTAGARTAETTSLAGEATLELFADGSGADYRAWNIGHAVTRPGTYLQGGRPTKVLALFLIGAWIGAAALPRLQSLRRPLVVIIDDCIRRYCKTCHPSHWGSSGKDQQERYPRVLVGDEE